MTFFTRIGSLALISVLLAGVFISCKKDNPVTPPNPTDTTKCDTCNTPTVDTTSHNFTWTEYSISGESSLSGVAVFSPSSIYVMGYWLYHFDGADWKKMEMRDVTGRLLGALSPGNLFAFSESNFYCAKGSIVIHATQADSVKVEATEFRLTDMNIMKSGEDGSLLASWGSSPTDMFFVGEKGTIIHYGGGLNWKNFPKVTNEDLRSVWGTGPNDVWACGYNSTTAGTILLHYDGTSWKEDSLSVNKRYATSGFYAVWASNSLGSKHVVTTGAFVGKRDANRKWDIDSEDVGNYLGGDSYVGLQAVNGLAANDFMVGGSWNFISHWNGKSWHRYDELYDYPNGGAIAGISMKSNTACSVGYKNGSWVAVGRRN